MSGSPGNRTIHVVLPSGWDIDSWLADADAHPDHWPYGMEHLERAGFTLTPLSLERPRPFALVIGLLRSWWLRRRGPAPDADICFTWDEKRLLRAICAPQTSRMRMVSGAIWVTDVDPDRPSRLRRWLVRTALRGCDLIFVQSRPQAPVLRQLLGRREPPIVFVPFGIDEQFFRATRPRPGNTVLCVGNDADRDFATFIEAMKLVRSVAPYAEVVVVSKTIDEHAPGWMTVVPSVSHRELVNLYGQCSVVVVATRPNLHVSGLTVALETLACRRSLVMTRTPGIEDFVGVTEARLVPPGDPSAMAAAVIASLGASEPDRIVRHTSRTMMSAMAHALSEAEDHPSTRARSAVPSE